jgi:hypothetical protein
MPPEGSISMMKNKGNYMPLNDAIFQVIQSVMPADAQIWIVPGTDALHVGVSWLLHDDPERPHKPSKTIAIIVSRDAVEDFGRTANLSSAQRRVTAFLQQQLAQFDPTHDTPKYEAPPVETWIITTQILNG